MAFVPNTILTAEALNAAFGGKADAESTTASLAAKADLVGGKVPTTQLPDAILGALSYRGTWDASSNTPVIPVASAENKGHYYVVSVAGSSSVGGVNDWEIGDWIVSGGSSWSKVDNSDKVSSVNGKTGVVDIGKTDVGLGNVDNTRDSDKPVSNATSEALGLKQNKTFTRGVTGSAARDVENKLNEIVSAKDFGASPSASASANMTALNNALRYLHDAGGGVLNVPAGIYNLSGPLYLGRNTTIKCETGVRFVRKHSGGFLTNQLDVTSATTGYNGNGNIVIDGGIWDGNPTEFYNSFSHFAIGHCENVIIRNVVFLDNIRSHCIDLSASKNVLIEDCKFLGFSYHQTSPDGYGTSADTLGNRDYAEAVQIDSNLPGSFFFGALDRTICKNVIFKNNVVGPNSNRSDNTFKSYAVGIGSHGAVHNLYARGIIVEGNVFDGCTFAGVRAYKWMDAVVVGNQFIGCDRGIVVNPVSYNQASANDAAGNPSGVGQAGKGFVFSANRFSSCVQQGIYFTSPELNASSAEPVFYHENISISCNSFSGGASVSSIDARWCSAISITGNSFNNVYRCLSINFARMALLSGNVASNVAREFLFFSETTPVEYVGLGHSNTITVSNNTGSNIGYSGINISGAAAGVSITGNRLSNVSTEAATRYGITCSSGVNGAFISDNYISDGGATNKPVYGIDVTSTCSNVVVGQNYAFGTSGSVRNLATGAGRRSVSGPMELINGAAGGGPAIYMSSFGTSDGEFAVPLNEEMVFGWWNGSAYTPVLGMSGAGNWNPHVDNTRSLGVAGNRWSVLFAGTGSINTSDENEKQQIRLIDQAVLSAWSKVNFCQYKFNDAVAEKGDNARWHFGVIAQRVKEAFEGDGIDPFEYGILCYDEWGDEYEDVIEYIANDIGDPEPIKTGERRLIRKGGSRYGIRYEEALALECAYLRSKIAT